MYDANVSRATTIGTTMSNITAGPRSRYSRPSRNPRIANGKTSGEAETSPERTCRQALAPSMTYERTRMLQATATYAAATGNAATTDPSTEPARRSGNATYAIAAPRYASA